MGRVGAGPWSNEGEELLKLDSLRDVGRFKVEAIFLEMPEEALNSPAFSIDRECFFSSQASADHDEVALTPSALNALAPKGEIAPKDARQPLGPVSTTPCSLCGSFVSDPPVLLDPHDGANVL